MNTLEQLYKPGHIAPLATFRLIFGAILFFHVLSFFFNGLIVELFIEPSFFFHAANLTWLKPLPVAGMYTVFGILALLAFLISIGFLFRYAAILFLLLYFYVSHIDIAQSAHFSDFYLLTLFILTVLPAHRYFSLDILRKPSLRVDFIPRWCIWAIKIQVAMLFFSAGLAKLNSQWLIECQPFLTWVNMYWGNGLLGKTFSTPWIAKLTCWFIVIVEFAGPVAMFFSKTKTKVYLFLTAFLLFSFILLPTGLLPIQIILLSTIYLSEKLHHNLTSRIAYFANDFLNFNPRVFKSGRNLMLAYKNKIIIPLFFTWMYGIILFSNVNIFISYLKDDHHLKDLKISEKLIINKKEGHLKLLIDNDLEVDLDYELTPSQIRAMSVDPSLMLQFSRHLKQKYRENEAYQDIKADAYISLNGKQYQRFINPNINLANFTGKSEELLKTNNKDKQLE